MANNPYLTSEENLPGNLTPVAADAITPGKAPLGAPAPPAPNDMPQFFSGSLAPQLQHDTSFVGTEVASPRVPKVSLMPLGLQASAFTNSASQSTASTTTVTPSGGDSDYYQIVQNAGSGLTQRNILNFIGFLVADDGGNSSTDVTAHIQFTLPSIFTSVADTNLPGPVVFSLATQNKNKFWAGPVSGADAAPTFRLIANDDFGSTGTAGQFLMTDGVSGHSPTWNTVYYQTVQSAGVSQTQRPRLNFLSDFVLTDNSGNTSTDVKLGAFTGDVTKAAGSLATTVVAWQGTPVSSTTPQLDQIMQFDGTKWSPIDMPAGASGTLYLDNAASPIGGGYLSLITTFPTTAEQTATATGTSGTSPVLAAVWASTAINVTTIPQGMWTPSIYAAVDSLTQNPQMLIRIYTRTVGGTETLQTTFTVNLTATAITLYTPTVELNNIATNPTDVLVVKIYLNAQGASSRTLTVYYDGSTHVSHVHIPVSTINAVRSEYVNAQSGTSYTFVDGDRGKLVTFSNTASVAVTLPQANSSTFVNGWFVDVQNNNKGLVTITPTTSTINGASSIALLKGQGFRIVSDGTNYQIVGFYVAGTPSNSYVPTYNSTNGDVEWTAITPSLGVVVKVNSVNVANNRLFFVKGVCDGAPAWGSNVNGTPDGG